jgi:hypothetical protein
MTIDTHLGKEKIELDKDALMLAYLSIDELYNQYKAKNDWNVPDKLNFILFKLEDATGYQYWRTIKKKERKDNKDDKQK